MVVPVYVPTNRIGGFPSVYISYPFSGFMKIAISNLLGISLNLYIALGSIIILMILILLIQEHDIYFHLSVSSSISFIRILQFSEYRSFASLGILFFLMVNGTVSLMHY